MVTAKAGTAIIQSGTWYSAISGDRTLEANTPGGVITSNGRYALPTRGHHPHEPVRHTGSCHSARSRGDRAAMS